jgi:hypothetical protein
MEVKTVEDAQQIVARIGVRAADWESAHGLEDELYVAVLQAIASGRLFGDEAVELAQAALKSKQFDFPRYCS